MPYVPFSFFLFPVFKTAVVLVYKHGPKQKKKLVSSLRLTPLLWPSLLSASQSQPWGRDSAAWLGVSLLGRLCGLSIPTPCTNVAKAQGTTHPASVQAHSEL